MSASRDPFDIFLLKIALFLEEFYYDVGQPEECLGRLTMSSQIFLDRQLAHLRGLSRQRT
jgi:hypothetical protein